LIAADTSVVVPALLTWHEHHDIARPRLGDDVWASPHVLLEAYAVVTRVPLPRRLTPQAALELLRDRFAQRTISLPFWDQFEALDTLAAAAIFGGASYDGLIALVARAAGAALLSLDKRAAATYRKLGVDFELLDCCSEQK